MAKARRQSNEALGAIEVQVRKTTWLKNILSNGTNGHAASVGSYAIAELNTQEGNNSFCSLSSNQFTLQPGTYEIEATIPYTTTLAATTSVFFKAKLVNVTDTSDVIIGQSTTQEHSTAAYRPMSVSAIRGIFTITTAKTFAIHQRTTQTGLVGYAISFGDSEVHAQVKITKVETSTISSLAGN